MVRRSTAKALMHKLQLKLKKLYLKLLKANVKRKWDKVRILNAKMIQLEIEINNTHKETSHDK
jgi:hypothetical protein